VGIWAKRRQTDPEVFYKQEDIWEFAMLPYEGKTVMMDPSLEQGLEALNARLRVTMDRFKKLPPKSPPP